MMKYLTTVLYLILRMTVTASAQPGAHEYAPLQEKQLEFKEFAYKTLDDQQLSLRQIAAGNKFVLVHFFAAWCHNSNFDVKTVNALYDKFKDQGLGVIGICEYSSSDELRQFTGKHHPAYPIVLESQSTKDRVKSSHYAYRSAVDDKRLWGTPFNVLLSVADFSESGDIVTKKALVAFGELEKDHLETLLKERLKNQN
jgi:peroxiredoxin